MFFAIFLMTSIINKYPKNALPLNVNKFQKPEQMV
jgi:hypothetical protein